MRLLRNPAHAGPCVLVMGMFDGVHRGHQQLLMTGAALAEQNGLPLHVCTYEPHPLAVLCPEKAPPMLTTLPERARWMQGFGVDALCVLSFNHTVADEAPEDFVRNMVKVFQPKHVVVGFNNTFGRGGKGDGALMTDGEHFLHTAGLRVQVRSTVAAGDSMIAGLAAGFARGLSMTETFRLGVAAATARCMTPPEQLIRAEDCAALAAQVEVRTL